MSEQVCFGGEAPGVDLVDALLQLGAVRGVVFAAKVDEIRLKFESLLRVERTDLLHDFGQGHGGKK